LQAIESVLAATGLIRRGAFHPRASDGVPSGGGTVVLIGTPDRPCGRLLAANAGTSPIRSIPGRGGC